MGQRTRRHAHVHNDEVNSHVSQNRMPRSGLLRFAAMRPARHAQRELKTDV